MTRHKRTIEQKFKAIVAMIVAIGLVTGFTLQDGTVYDAWSAPVMPEHTTHTCSGGTTEPYNDYGFDATDHWEICTVCGAESTHHALNFTTHYGHHTDDLDYPMCDDCGWYDTSVSGIACSYTYSYDPAVDIDGNPTTHTLICTQCGNYGGSESHTYVITPNAGTETHKNTCTLCTKSFDSACTMVYVNNGDGTHQAKCAGCNRDDKVSCTLDSDGLCDVCQHADKVAKDAAKAAAKTLYDTAKASYNWQDSYGNTSINDPTDSPAVWVTGLTPAEFSALVSLYNDMSTKYSALDSNLAVQGKVDDYMVSLPSMYGLLGAITYRMATPLADVLVKINVYEKGTTTPITDVSIKLTGSAHGNAVIKHGYNIVLDGGTATSQTGTSVILANDTFTVSQDGTAANGYKDLATGTYAFDTVYAGPDYFNIVSSAPSDVVVKASPDVLNIFIDPLPIVEVALVKSDAPGTPLTAGASIKLSDGIAASPDVEYNIGDRIVVGIPTGTGNISKSGKLIIIKSVQDITILEGTTPAGYDWGSGDSKFQASAADPTVLSKSGIATRHAVAGNKLTVQFTKIPVITAKFLEKTTNTALTGCSVKIQSDANPTQSAIFEPGDTIHVGTPVGGADISKTGTVITIKASTDYKVLSDIGPLYHENLQDETYKFRSDALGVLLLSGGAGTGDVAVTPPSELDFYFDKASTIKFTTSGDGHPDKTGLVITEKFGAKRSFTVASAASPSVELADGEYTVTTTNAAKGYKGATGTIKIVGGKVSSTDCKPACYYSADDTVEIKYTKSDNKLDDKKVYVYPKKSGKDAPDTEKSAIKDWSYVLQRYDGDKSDPTKDSDNWKTVISKLEPASGKDYAVIEGEKLSLGETYRIKMGDNSYAYFKLKSDGDIDPIKGNIATDDDGDDILLWLDEDSDDVIAIHKIAYADNSELAGAKLQLFKYTTTNSLLYGSSKSNSASSTVQASISDDDTNTNTTTTKKTTTTTKTKPTVATADVIEEWTSTNSAHLINISKLTKGETYTIREVSAPTGYSTPAYDFTFTYGTDGKITVKNNYASLLSANGNKIYLKNQTTAEAAANRPKTGDRSKVALWLDICIVMLGGLYLSGYGIFDAFTEKKKVKVVAKKKQVRKRK